MHRVEPEIFLVGESHINREELKRYLEAIGALEIVTPEDGQNNWTLWSSDAPDEVSEIIEVMSRSCYMSFGSELNPNLTKVRSSNKAHLANIVAVNHGSVLEHGWTSWMFHNVSRVFTHELVRHRVGTAISQESLRFVRQDDIGLWIPSCFADNPAAVAIFQQAWQQSEAIYQALIYTASDAEGEEWNKLSFDKKKEYTSAARRVLPIGLATNIGWSCNIRELRHVIQMRTDPSAEEEIRVVFKKVKELAVDRWPNLFPEELEEKKT